MLYCPVTYAKMMQKTFLQSQSVFKPCEGSPVQFAATIHHRMPKILKPRIKKIFQWQIGLPKAFILPKGKICINLQDLCSLSMIHRSGKYSELALAYCMTLLQKFIKTCEESKHTWKHSRSCEQYRWTASKLPIKI